MARTRTVVEKHLQKAEATLTRFVAQLGGRPHKKELRKNPNWRRLRAEADKFRKQLGFIDKRNKKKEA